MSWTDSVLTTEISIKRVHIHEIRDMLDLKSEISCPVHHTSLHTTQQLSNYTTYYNTRYDTDDVTKNIVDNTGVYTAQNDTECPLQCPSANGAVQTDYLDSNNVSYYLGVEQHANNLVNMSNPI